MTANFGGRDSFPKTSYVAIQVELQVWVHVYIHFPASAKKIAFGMQNLFKDASLLQTLSYFKSRNDVMQSEDGPCNASTTTYSTGWHDIDLHWWGLHEHQLVQWQDCNPVRLAMFIALYLEGHSTEFFVLWMRAQRYLKYMYPVVCWVSGCTSQNCRSWLFCYIISSWL